MFRLLLRHLQGECFMCAENYCYMLWWLRLATLYTSCKCQSSQSVRYRVAQEITSCLCPEPDGPVSFIYILYYPSTPRFFKSSLSCRFSNQTFLYAIVFPHIRHNRRPSPSPPFDHPNYIRWDVSILCLVTVPYPQSTVSSSTLDPNTLLSAILTTIFSFRSLLNASDQRFTRI
jgi:hypothetical protein